MIDAFLSQISKSTQHTCFYHFTDRRNLPSIRQHGLMSWKALQQKELNCVAPGGNDWSREADVKFGVDGFVHLCLTTGHPMLHKARQDGRITDAVWLRIDPSILKLEGVLMTTDVANKSGVASVAVEAALPELDYDVVYKRTDWKDPAIRQRLSVAEKWEILVPYVPIEFILNPNG